MATIFAKFRMRSDDAADWTAADPVLEAGEFGHETDTGKFKIGDNSTLWSALGYRSEPGADGDDASPVLIDNTAVDGIRLKRMVTAGVVTIGLESTLSHVAFVGWIPIPPREVVLADFDAATRGNVDDGTVIPALPSGQSAAWLWFAVPIDDPYGYPLHIATGGFRQPDNAFASQGNALMYDGVNFAIGQSVNPLNISSVGQTLSWEF